MVLQVEMIWHDSWIDLHSRAPGRHALGWRRQIHADQTKLNQKAAILMSVRNTGVSERGLQVQRIGHWNWSQSNQIKPSLSVDCRFWMRNCVGTKAHLELGRRGL